MSDATTTRNPSRRWRRLRPFVLIVATSLACNAVIAGVGATFARTGVSSDPRFNAWSRGSCWYGIEETSLDLWSVAAAAGTQRPSLASSLNDEIRGVEWVAGTWVRGVYRREFQNDWGRQGQWLSGVVRLAEPFDERFDWCDPRSLVNDHELVIPIGDSLVREAFAVGWPCRSAVGYADWHGREMPSYGNPRTIIAVTSDVLRSTGLLWFGSDDGSGTLESATFVLPYQPIWSGLLLNVAAWCVPGAFMVFAWKGLGAVRAYHRRRRQGRCSRCGYILHGAPRCPECGADDASTPD